MNNNPDINKILNQKNIDRKTLEKAKESGDASALVNKLSDSDKQKLNAVLSDKQKLAEVLQSPEAKMLLKLFGGGKNG